MSGRSQAKMVKVTPDEYDMLIRISGELHNREALLSGGSICPCCNNLVRAYKRKMNRRQALIVLRMQRMGGWLKGVDLPGDNHEISQLEWWGLVDGDPDRNGYWRLNKLGDAFARGETTVEEYMIVFNGKPIGRSTEDITISAALGRPFDLDDLLAPIPNE